MLRCHDANFNYIEVTAQSSHLYIVIISSHICDMFQSEQKNLGNNKTAGWETGLQLIAMVHSKCFPSKVK